MFIFDCVRSGRLSWMLVQSAVHHDVVTASICLIGMISRWTVQTSLTATLVCCLLFLVARWIAARRLGQPQRTPNRGLRLALKASTWNFIFIVRRRSSKRWPRQWQCLLRIRSRNESTMEAPREVIPQAEAMRQQLRQRMESPKEESN